MKRIALDTNDLVERYNGGESENALSKRYEVSRTVVRRNLVIAGAHIRNQSESESVKWARMTAKQRAVQVSAAHDAARGRIHTEAEKVKRAKRVEELRLHVSESERTLAAMLNERGIDTRPQQAIGIYNCDLGAFPVDIEIWGGNWHWSGEHMERTPRRIHHILNTGWHVLIVNVTKRFPLTDETADYIAAYVKRARRNPSAPREYRVIRSSGQVLASGGAESDHFTIVFPFHSCRNSSNGQYNSIAK